MCSCSSKHRGFTLLELLVAVAVFAIMAVMAYGGLQNVIFNSEVSRDAVARLQQVQTAVSALSRDLSQVHKRNIIDAFGVPKPYMLADSRSELLVEFTRSGRRNPAGLPRSSLQRVGYRLEDGKLYRVAWRNLDQAQSEEPLESEILTDVEDMSFRFMDETGQWSDSWPPLSTDASGAPVALRALSFTLELKDWGQIEQLFEVVL